MDLSDEQAQQAKLEHSVIGRLGQAIEPVIKPLGFDWKIGTALIGATAAKEVFVSQLAIVYAVGSADEGTTTLRQQLQANYTPLTGVLFDLCPMCCNNRDDKAGDKFLEMGDIPVLQPYRSGLYHNTCRLSDRQPDSRLIEHINPKLRFPVCQSKSNSYKICFYGN
jgi:hypothetical protein